MAGKLCFGRPNHSAGAAVLEQSKAYCEGRTANAEGALQGDNPHPAGSPSAQSWTLGYITGGAGTVGDRDCCALPPGSGQTATIVSVDCNPDTLTIANGGSEVTTVAVSVNGIPLPNVQVTAESNNTNVATVDDVPLTDANGEAIITINGVAALGGGATVVVSYAGESDSVAVTVSSP
jgi:hypothetical protein